MDAVDELNALLGIGPPKAKLPITLQKSGYQAIKPIGKGGFGQAHLIFHTKQKVYYVAKHINLLTMSVRQRKEAHNEIMVLQQLNHPNIVRYVEYVEERSHLYIVMEYADGGDLASHLSKLKSSRKHLSEDQVISLFAQTGLALQYMHDKKMLHRDIKAANVFLTKAHVVKLGDFGISTVLQNTIQMAKTVCGTPCYFSPELCQGKPYNSKSDIWAMGVMLYEMMTNNLPFDSPNIKRLMDDICRNDPPPLPVGHKFSPELVSLMMSMLNKDPRSRPDIKSILHSHVIQRRMPDIVAQLGIYASDVPVPRPPPTHQLEQQTQQKSPAPAAREAVFGRARQQPVNQQQLPQRAESPPPSKPVPRGQPDPLRVSQVGQRGPSPQSQIRQAHQEVPQQQQQQQQPPPQQQQRDPPRMIEPQHHFHHDQQQQRPQEGGNKTALGHSIKQQPSQQQQQVQLKDWSKESMHPPQQQQQPQPQPQQPRPGHHGDTIQEERYNPALLRMSQETVSELGDTAYQQEHGGKPLESDSPLIRPRKVDADGAEILSDDEDQFVVHHHSSNHAVVGTPSQSPSAYQSSHHDLASVIHELHNLTLDKKPKDFDLASAQREESQESVLQGSSSTPQQQQQQGGDGGNNHHEDLYFVDEFGATLDVQSMLNCFDENGNNVKLKEQEAEQRKLQEEEHGSSPALASESIGKSFEAAPGANSSGDVVSGQCLCGALVYSVMLQAVIGTFTCTCDSCRRVSGSTLGIDWMHCPEDGFMSLVVQDAGLARGNSVLKRFQIIEQHGVKSTLYSCAICSSPLAIDGHRGVTGCTITSGSMNGTVNFGE